MVRASTPSKLVARRTQRRLAKLAEADGVSILEDFFSRLVGGEVAVPAASFRLAHECKADRIRRLTRLSFITHRHEAAEIYQLRLIALVLIEDSRANAVLQVCDDVLRYMDARFRQDPDNRDNKVFVADMVEATERDEYEVCEALRYLVDTPGLTPGSVDFPDGEDAYAMANEQSRMYGTVDALVLQLLEFVGTSAAPLASFLESGGNDKTRFDKVVASFKNHPIFAWVIFVGFAITVLGAVLGSWLYLYDRISSWFS